jgi:heptosyltransferase III
MIDTLKQNYPNALVDFLINKRVYELVQNYPNINKVHALEKDSIRDILHICKEGNYDIAVIVRPLFSVALAVFLAGVKIRLGTGYRWYSFLFNLRHYQHRKYSVKHELEYNLDLLNELNCIRLNDVSPRLAVEESVTKNVIWKLKEKKINLSKPLIIIHPGSLGSAMTWSVENFVELIRMLAEDKNFDFSLVVTGTKSDQRSLNIIAEAAGDKVLIINDLGLKEFAAICKLSKMFVSNSTGPIHIAAAVGTFCVGLFSPVKTESAKRWAPYTDKKMIFSPEVTNKHVPDNIMDKITPEKVYEFINNYMSTKLRTNYEIN